MPIWRRQWQPTLVLLPGKSHGQRSLVGYSSWGHEELDTTEGLHFHFSLSSTGEGNSSPLQCSCLKNPRDGGAWWAAIYGVAQSWTRLKDWSDLAAAVSCPLNIAFLSLSKALIPLNFILDSRLFHVQRPMFLLLFSYHGPILLNVLCTFVY